MNPLNEQASQNLQYILDMNNNDTFIGRRGELTKSDEFIPIDNLHQLEYTIYFTYNQLLNNPNSYLIYNNDLILKLDISIDKLYENKQFNDLLCDKKINIIINDIESKLDFLKETYYYKSPFFTFLKRTYNTYHNIKEIMLENNVYITKISPICGYPCI